MKIDKTGFTDKASRDPDQLRIYEEQHPDDYVSAYAAHTAWRIEHDGPHQAIGGQWEEHGPLQLAFLRRQGLRPDSYLLDLGCGTGRLARHAAPFLEPGHYVGVDICAEAIAHAEKLAVVEGWDDRLPAFHLADRGGLPVGLALRWPRFDFVWAHSVFTHCPPEIVRLVFDDLSRMGVGAFFFTYKKWAKAERTGLKQFRYPLEFFVREGTAAGFRVEGLADVWPAGQRTAVARPA